MLVNKQDICWPINKIMHINLLTRILCK